MPMRTQLLTRLPFLLLTLWLACCRSGPDLGTEPLPKLSELRPAGAELPAAPPGSEAPIVAAHLLRLEFPPDADLERAWAIARDVGAAPPSAALWPDNGMRVAVVGMDQLKRVFDTLPPPQVRDDSRIVAQDQVVPLPVGWVVTRPLTLRLILAPGVATPAHCDRGRFQFLAHFGAAGPGAAIALTPHLYLPHASLLPRSPIDAQLDGDRFDALTLRAYLMPQQALMIGVATEAASPATQPAVAPSAATQPAAPPRVLVPDHLGTALLTGSRQDRPRQVLMFLAVEPRTIQVQDTPK
jgi:hypothetical protein